jgi:hypothetical protein
LNTAEAELKRAEAQALSALTDVPPQVAQLDRLEQAALSMQVPSATTCAREQDLGKAGPEAQ